MNTETYNKSLPLTAAALSDNRGIKVEIGGEMAWTDNHVIHVPALPLDADETLLGVARGYLDHESAHVLFSEFNALNHAQLTPLEKYLANAVEDTRVEKLMSQRYPGSAKNLSDTARHVFIDKAKDTDPDPAFAVPRYVLLHLRARSCPELAFKEQEVAIVVALFFPGLLPDLLDVMAEIETSCPDTQASIAYGKRLAALLEAYEQQHAGQPVAGANAGNADGSADGESSGESDQVESPAATDSSGDATPENSAGNDDGHGDPTGNEQADNADTNSDAADATAQAPSLSPLFADDVADHLPKGIGETLADELTENKSRDPYEAIRTAVEVTNPIDFTPMPAHLLDNTLRLQAALRPMLRGVLQADTLEGRMPATQGKLNSRRLYSVPLGNQHIFQQRISARLEDTALEILVDRSGSTSGVVHEIAASAFAVSHAASGIRGVSVGLSAFPVCHPGDGDQPGVTTLIKHGQTAPRYLDFNASGGTPLAEALWFVLPKLMRQRCSRRILLIFTDGCPDSMEKAKMALKDAAKLDVEVYGVSYVNTSIVDLIGEQRSIVIRDIAELPKSLTQMLLSALRRAA